MVEARYPRELTVRVSLHQRTVSATTGAWQTAAVSGRTDGLVWLSLTRDGPKISDALELPLVAVGTTTYYQATFDGPTLAIELADVRGGTKLYEVVQFGTDAPQVKPWVWRPTRADA